MFTHMLPLLVFTTFAGIAAGAYVVDALFKVSSESDSVTERPWLFPLVSAVLLAIGLCGTLAHLGQPLRFMNGMANPASMISQEAYWSIAFGVVIVVDFILAKVKGAAVRPVRWIGAVLATGLMVVTGLAYFNGLGIAAWCGAATIPLFVFGDLVLGAGLCALFDVRALRNGGFSSAVLALAVAFAVVLAAYGFDLARLGIDSGALLCVAGAIGSVAVGAIAIAVRAEAISARIGAPTLCALAFIGVVIARYVFFAAGL